MEFLDAIANIGVSAAIGSVIAFIIQIIKVLLQKLPWKWAQSIPSTVWIVISVLMGIGIAVYMNYNVLDEVIKENLPIPEFAKVVITGIGIGGSSKVVYDVAAPVGAKLTAVRKESEIKTTELNTKLATTQQAEPILAATTATTTAATTAATTEVVTPIEISQETTIDDKTTSNIEDKNTPKVFLVKQISTKADFVIIDGKIYKI